MSAKEVGMESVQIEREWKKGEKGVRRERERSKGECRENEKEE